MSSATFFSGVSNTDSTTRIGDLINGIGSLDGGTSLSLRMLLLKAYALALAISRRVSFLLKKVELSYFCWISMGWSCSSAKQHSFSSESSSSFYMWLISGRPTLGRRVNVIDCCLALRSLGSDS